jgi:hypothetical protein
LRTTSKRMVHQVLNTDFLIRKLVWLQSAGPNEQYP